MSKSVERSWTELQATLSRMRTALEDAEKDAKRYKWLRDEWIFWKPPQYDGLPFGRFCWDDIKWPTDNMDEMIDAAIAERALTAGSGNE